MERAIGTFFIYRKERCPVSGFHYTPGKDHIYEVIRISQGIPLFLEDHLARMNESLGLVGADPFRSVEEVKGLIRELVEANGVVSGNLKLIRGSGGEDDLLIYLIPFSYPTPDMYENGVPAGTILLERTNPNAKVVNADYKAQVSRYIESSGVYEAILVNRDREMTEGSRSNLFFVLDDILVTPPLENVLGGITRKKVIALARQNHIPFREGTVSVDEIGRLCGVFLTGTSPRILPIRSIDDRPIPSTGCAIIRQLMDSFDDEIRSYLMRDI